MSILKFSMGAVVGCALTLVLQERLTPDAGEVWSFSYNGREYHVTVIQVNDRCVIVDQAGVPVTIPLDILKFIAHP